MCTVDTSEVTLTDLRQILTRITSIYQILTSVATLATWYQ